MTRNSREMNYSYSSFRWIGLYLPRRDTAYNFMVINKAELPNTPGMCYENAHQMANRASFQAKSYDVR